MNEKGFVAEKIKSEMAKVEQKTPSLGGTQASVRDMRLRTGPQL